MKTTLSLLALATLAACASTSTVGAGETPVAREPVGECDAGSAQRLIGATATADLGARLLRTTGARTLRWVPPRTAVTMDYRPDRLTVGYDDDMSIERITCG